MEYEGAIYGRVGGQYFPLQLSTTDVDKMEKRLAELEEQVKVKDVLPNSVLSEEKEIDWTVPDANGNINIPDELDVLFNKIGMQMRFHTISGKNELQTVVDMVWIAAKFFKEKYEKAA